MQKLFTAGLCSVLLLSIALPAFAELFKRGNRAAGTTRLAEIY